MRYILLTLILVSAGAMGKPLDDEHEKVVLGLDTASFSADYYFEKTGKPQGGLILSHNGNNLVMVSNIGHILSQHGWSVLLYQQLEQDQDTQSQLETAINYMETKRGIFNLCLLASGPSWGKASQYLATEGSNIESIKALILLNTDKEMEIKELTPELLILDIVTENLPSLAYQSRKLQAQRYKLDIYQQMILHLPIMPNTYGENKLTKRIRGWLLNNVKGMEIGKS